MKFSCIRNFALAILMSNSPCLLNAQELIGSVRAEGVNLRDFGAIGDGKADDTVALRRAIDVACGIGEADKSPHAVARKLVIPVGVYRITETITLNPEHYGLQFIGEGSPLQNKPIGSALAPNSKLLWDGLKNGTLMQVFAMKGLQMKNLVLDGNQSAGSLLRVNSIDQTSKEKQRLEKYGRLASSGFRFEHVKFQNADKGILLNDDSYINSDESTFNDIIFYNLETGFEARSEQNLCYYFNHANAGNVGTVFKFFGGGAVHAVGVNCHHTDVVFDIEKGGINGGVYNLIQVRAEQGARQKGKRPVSLKASGEVNINMVGLQTMANAVMGPTPDLETPALILGAGANVLVASSMITAKIAKLTGDPADVPTFLTFENTRFRIHSDPLGSGIECDAYSGFRLRDCQISYDEEKDGTYRILSRKFVADHLSLPSSITPK